MRRRREVCLTVLSCCVVLVLASSTLADDDPRFVHVDGLLAAPTRWISIDGDRVAFGSQHVVSLARIGVPLVPESSFRISSPISTAELVEDGLYVVSGSSLRHLDLGSEPPRATPVELSPAPRGRLLTTRMPDYLVVAEVGVGLRFVALPPPREMRGASHMHDHPDTAEQVGFLALGERFTAIAASGKSVYAAVEGGGLAIIDAGDPSNPRLQHRFDTRGDLHALDANGSTLYTLGPSGLEIIDAARGVVTESLPEISGNALRLSGRDLLVGVDEGLHSLRDLSPTMATFFVTVGNFFFEPVTLNVAVGDTVQWDFAGGGHRSQRRVLRRDSPATGECVLRGERPRGRGFLHQWTAHHQPVHLLTDVYRDGEQPLLLHPPCRGGDDGIRHGERGASRRTRRPVRSAGSRTQVPPVSGWQPFVPHLGQFDL